MRRIFGALALIPLVAACGGPPKDMAVKSDVELVESRINQKLAQELSQLRAEFADLQTRFERVKTLSDRLEIQKKELEALTTKLETMSKSVEGKVVEARDNVSKSLQIQEQYLKQQLESIRALIEELKK